MFHFYISENLYQKLNHVVIKENWCSIFHHLCNKDNLAREIIATDVHVMIVHLTR